jgi:hypothetical protein
MNVDGVLDLLATHAAVQQAALLCCNLPLHVSHSVTCCAVLCYAEEGHTPGGFAVRRCAVAAVR